ncbi:DUF1254 domain-containing protein [Photobacterium sp. 1_MG-2023]|uniref:DUF1254 domain-containing protein n=1 Tax=Photobacterium sp. 1_MG-2023 TaxID=3062646 RepID=UPI0026E1908B|nr:DUF1254 domain-containing protein [Photobacterium sp. 1_MG-2023]MDO6708137.1 DUF1254 domain-containing protein [Photobacterium sp. 1_MG-2023]
MKVLKKPRKQPFNLMPVAVALTLALGMFAAGPADAEAPLTPLTKQINQGNWLAQDEAETLRDELFYQRAVHAYMTMQPALNVIGMRDGSEAEFGKGYQVLPIWKQRMDSRTLVPTPNADVIYSMSYLDLKETGPLVVKAPPNVIGMFTDFFQRTITDVGAIGPDRARGGLYLLLPPGYQGHVPSSYFAFESSTYNVFLFFRTVMKKGEGKPDPVPAVQLAETTRVYPLWAEEKNIKPMEFPDASGKPLNMMYPVDNTYWDKLKAFVDYEPVTAIDPELRGVLASIGIVKGQPFEPTQKQQELLKKAVETAPKMILAMRQLGREDERNRYYKDRQWERAWGAGTAEWMQESYLDVDQRAAFFQYAYSSAPAMVMRTTGAGSKYPYTTRDADGDFLNGSNSYRLHLPKDIPAALFWAVTAYNITDGTMPETDQLLPSTNGYYDIPKNKDGSIDIWFGPSKPKDVVDAAFIQTVPGRDYLVALRLYGAMDAFYDQTWKPDDIVKVK